MKKKQLKKLKLKKSTISKFSQTSIKGGGTWGCLSGGSWCCTLAGCPPVSEGCTEASACCPPKK